MTVADWAARIERSKEDAEELSRIAEELKSCTDAGAAKLRIKVGALKFQLHRSAGSSPSTFPRPAMPERPVPSWLAELGLPHIDKRALYRYRLTDTAFKQLETRLRQRHAALVTGPDNVLAAQFVLWAAEWFRRCYDGTGQRWDALGEALGLNATWAHYRTLTDTGLRKWRIPELRINGTHHRLAAIARQGGFPIAAVEGKAAGWAPRFLERLVGLLLAEPGLSLDVAEHIAGSLMDLVPQTWRNQEIRIVSAELAVEVIRLRRLAEAEGAPAGLLVSAWLDQHHAGWREDLPIGIGSEAGHSLIDGLMKTVVLKGGAGAVCVRRLLSVMPESRRERIELKLDGALNDAEGRAISPALGEDWNRLRLYPAGAFARHVSGELATADPEDDGVWIARASTTRSKFDLPGSVSVTAELRGGGQRVGDPFALCGGAAVSAGLRVYVAESEELESGRLELVLIGVGSGGYRPERLYADLPDRWTCVAHTNDALCERSSLGQGTGRTLWIVEKAALVTSDHGDLYLLRTGQTADRRDRLLMRGDFAIGCAHVDPSLPLFIGAPALRLSEGPRERAPLSGEAFWRPLGSRSWLASPQRARPGACEFAWRDATTGHIRDRQDAVVLPSEFRIDRRRIGEWFEVGVSGWPGAIEIDGGVKAGDAKWHFPMKASSRSACTLTLRGGVGAPVCLSVPLPRHAWIDDWTNGALPRGARISLSTINRCVARADGRCELLGDLLDRDRRPVPQATTSWWVEGELALSAIRDDIAALLRPLGDIRATVKLEFNDGQDYVWYVSEFDHELTAEGGRWIPDRPVAEDEVQIVGRELRQPINEHPFGDYGLLSGLVHRPFDLPHLYGDWLVYLRSNERVLSCPRFVRGAEPEKSPTTALGNAMAVRDRDERFATLCDVLDVAFETPSSPQCREVVAMAIDLALSLDGLPPATFDLFNLISHRPLLGPLMLFNAVVDNLDALLRLMDGLPTAWALIPIASWDKAGKALADHLFEFVPDQPPLIAQMVGDRRRAISEREPTLAPLLGLGSQVRPLNEAANAFINRSSDRIEGKHNPFRPRLTAQLRPWNFDEYFQRALDAPIAAALSAKGLIKLVPAEVACVKDIGRRHPRWFREGFAAALKGT